MAQQGTLEGREAQFREMMEKFAEIQSKYRGVRGELLEKVREELMQLEPKREKARPVVTPAASTRAVTKPARAPATPAAPARAAAAAAPEVVAPPAPRTKVATNTMLPSCRSCGRTMREAADGSLVCQNGHVRALAS